jgi:hypothetical protein
MYNDELKTIEKKQIHEAEFFFWLVIGVFKVKVILIF